MNRKANRLRMLSIPLLLIALGAVVSTPVRADIVVIGSDRHGLYLGYYDHYYGGGHHRHYYGHHGRDYHPHYRYRDRYYGGRHHHRYGNAHKWHRRDRHHGHGRRH